MSMSLISMTTGRAVVHALRRTGVRVNEAGPGRHESGGAARPAGQETPAADQPQPEQSGAGAGLDEVRIGELYREHGLMLVRIALLLVGDKATAEDVVQDAFFGLFRARDRLADPAKALAYLRVSVVNGSRSVHRTRRRAQLQHLPDQPVWSAESVVMAREDSRLALQAVARLPVRAREVLALRFYLDMPDREIAATLRISRGTVSSTISRALTTLARELGEQR